MNSIILLAVLCQQPGEFVITEREEFKITAPTTQSADIPFADTGWQSGSDIRQHLLSHGCPSWVVDYYSNSPAILIQIHSGYHEKERGGRYVLKKVTAPLTPEKAAAKPTVVKDAPVQIPVKPGWTLDCNGRRCRWVRN